VVEAKRLDPLSINVTTRYFPHPYHSWERGLNENTNGLLRQYFPKGTNFTTITPADVLHVEICLTTDHAKR